jgi:hypothetical protein
VRNDYFIVCFQTRLYPASLPVPEYDVPSAVAATDPFSIRRKPDLASITGNRMPCKCLFPILSEIVRTVYQNLVVERLGGEVFFWKKDELTDCKLVLDHTLDGCRVTEGMECMCGSAIYLITTGMSQSQARIVLSSEVVTKRLLSSTKVIVFTGPKC